jgi:hypothetical protein
MLSIAIDSDDFAILESEQWAVKRALLRPKLRGRKPEASPAGAMATAYRIQTLRRKERERLEINR